MRSHEKRRMCVSKGSCETLWVPLTLYFFGCDILKIPGREVNSFHTLSLALPFSLPRDVS